MFGAQLRKIMILILVALLCYVVTGSIAEAGLECIPGNVRQLNVSDVQVSYVELAFNHFFNILYGDSRFSWSSNAVPNVGRLTFSQNFVLIALSTQGAYAGIEERYVSSFTLQYTEDPVSLSDNDTIYVNDTKTFDVNTAAERFFFFDEPILLRSIELIILNTSTAGTADSYFWYLDLIGCPQPDNVENEMSTSATETTDMYSKPETAIMATITPSFVTSTVSTNKLITSPSALITNDIATSFTVIGTSTAQNNKSCDMQVAIVAIVPSVILLVILCVVITAWLVTCYHCNNKRINKVPDVMINREKTLKNIQNNHLYAEPAIVTASTNPIEDNIENGMIYNALYSTQRSSQDSLLSEENDDGVYHYAEVDVIKRNQSVKPMNAETTVNADYCASAIEMTQNKAYIPVNK